MTTTRGIVEIISQAGYSVLTGADSDGNSVAEAADKTIGERFIVRAEDLYSAVVELAQQVGLELEDA